MANPNEWMPLYVARYLADTGRLTTEGHGAYMLLIMEYWQQREALPDDDETLAAVARLPVPRWTRLRPSIARFFEVEDGKWRHKRIDEELAKAKAVREARSAAGKQGGRPPNRPPDGPPQKPKGFSEDNQTESNGEAGENHSLTQEQEQEEEPRDSKIQDLVSSAARGARGPSPTASPEGRKAVWFQRISDHLHATRPTARAQEIVAGYLEDQPWARAEFERADREIKARKTRGAA